MCKVICCSEHDDANAEIYFNQLELFFLMGFTRMTRLFRLTVGEKNEHVFQVSQCLAMLLFL